MKRLSASAALLLAAVIPAQAWTLTVPGSTAGVPLHRSWSRLCMEWTRGTSLLFGGFDSTSATMASLGDTWTYNAATNGWTQLQPATSPLARDSHMMAYDQSRNVTVLFGGWDTNGNELNDTWEWNGTNWNLITPSGSGPVARHDGAMVFDSARGTCILWGGSDFTLGFDYADTWEWNGTSWTQLNTPAWPLARSGHSMAYDVARARTVMFGGWDANGTPLGDTWEFNGTTWAQVTTALAPAPRLWTAMAYDIARGTTVLFGGAGAAADFNDTWEYNGAWTQRTSTSAPAPLDSQAMTFDIGQNAMVMFGGYDTTLGVDLSDTWEYTAAPAASYVTFGSGCAGSAGVPALAAQNLPTLGTTFRLAVQNLPAGPGALFMVLGLNRTSWNGIPLPLSLTPFGMTGCSALCSLNSTSLLLHAGGSATWSLPLPNRASLSGVHFYNQALSLDPAAGNPAGIVVSNAGDGTLR